MINQEADERLVCSHANPWQPVHSRACHWLFSRETPAKSVKYQAAYQFEGVEPSQDVTSSRDNMFCNAVPRISGMFVDKKIIENLGLRHLFCIDTLKARY
jgi:hypothetical protein